MTSALAPSMARALAATAEALLAAREGRSEGLVTVLLPIEVVETLAGSSLASLRGHATASWERPATGAHVFGFGAALRLRGAPGQGLAGAIPVLRALRHGAVAMDVPRAVRPRLFGGCRFDDKAPAVDPAWEAFGGWQFVLPRVLVTSEGGRLMASATALIRDGDTAEGLAEALAEAFRDTATAVTSPAAGEGIADGHAWRRAVATAVEEIHAGRYQKVVLARRAPAGVRPGTSPADVIGRLAERYADCFVFGFRAGDSSWVGASPELLVSLAGGEVRAVSLAGSRPRGSDAAADDALGVELMASEKERSEHAFVVEAVRDTLGPLCADLTVPDEPILMRLANIQHLYTPLTGLAAEGVDVLDFVVRMHPTPAVGGSPRAEALEAVRRLEGMDRGWYAAPIGWLDLAGDGEFAVGLRAGLLSSSGAVLYAGAGIVAGSDPDQEFAEVELKLRPLRAALGGE